MVALDAVSEEAASPMSPLSLSLDLSAAAAAMAVVLAAAAEEDDEEEVVARRAVAVVVVVVVVVVLVSRSRPRCWAAAAAMEFPAS